MAFSHVHIEWAKKTICSGGRVVLERRYVNKAPDIVMIIGSKAELADWKNRVAKAVEALKKI